MWRKDKKMNSFVFQFSSISNPHSIAIVVNFPCAKHLETRNYEMILKTLLYSSKLFFKQRTIQKNLQKTFLDAKSPPRESNANKKI